MAIEPITLERAKQHLNVTLPDDDDYIGGLITAARQMAEGRLNRTLVRRARRAVFDAMDLYYTLRNPPVVAVTSVSLSGVSEPLDPATYVLQDRGEDTPPRLLAVPGATWPATATAGGTVAVEYTAGYADGEVPAPIVQWMLLVIGTMYENRETMSAGVQIFSMPEDFMTWLLQPYMVYE